jgi:hypothetical protein
MIRILLLPRRDPSTVAPAFRRLLGAAPAALCLSCLLAAGCGQDNQSVPENFPSGARPAPLTAADLAALRAGQSEVPPPPPAEPSVELTPAQQTNAAVAARPGSEAAPGHLRLSGTYQADTNAVVTCTDSPTAAIVEVTVADFLGTGHYVAATRVFARDTPRGVRSAAGEAQIDIQVAEVDRPHVRSLLAGSFSGAYGSQGIQGQVAGSFDRCLYAGALP